MAPSTIIDGLSGLAARALCPSGYYYSRGYCYRRSSWSSWGRWVFAGVIIVAILTVLVLCSCLNSRRRRKQGLAPRYGTGWLAPAPKYTPGNNNNYAPGPPQYSAPMQNYPTNPQQGQYTGQTYNPNEGYYGGQNEGIAPPQNAYYPQQRGVGGENVYEPPAGPPPGKR